MPNTKVKVLGKDIDVASQVVLDDSGVSTVKVTATVGGHTVSHITTIGADDQPLPDNYALADLQAHVDSIKSKVAALCEGRQRAATIASQLT